MNKIDYTPLNFFRKFVQRFNSQAIKEGGTAGQVPIKTNSTDFAWSWGNLVVGNVTNLQTLLDNRSLVGHVHTLSQVTGLITALSEKAPLASPVFTGTVRLPGYTVATLPVGTVGQMAYVTDATSPTYNGALTGGGAVVVRVFFDGAIWRS